MGNIAGDLEHLAYELSLRVLERQERLVDELRARTGTMLAVSSIAASFLGAQAADRGTGFLTVAAVGMFVTSISAGTYILLPKGTLIFSVRGSVLLERESRESSRLPETHRRLAYWLEDYYDDNQVVVNRQFFLFRVASLAVLLQVVLWVLEIAI